MQIYAIKVQNIHIFLNIEFNILFAKLKLVQIKCNFLYFNAENLIFGKISSSIIATYGFILEFVF